MGHIGKEFRAHGVEFLLGTVGGQQACGKRVDVPGKRTQLILLGDAGGDVILAGHHHLCCVNHLVNRHDEPVAEQNGQKHAQREGEQKTQQQGLGNIMGDLVEIVQRTAQQEGIDHIALGVMNGAADDEIAHAGRGVGRQRLDIAGGKDALHEFLIALRQYGFQGGRNLFIEHDGLVLGVDQPDFTSGHVADKAEIGLEAAAPAEAGLVILGKL